MTAKTATEAFHTLPSSYFHHDESSSVTSSVYYNENKARNRYYGFIFA